MFSVLPLLEERVRVFTDDFKVTQWVMLYHGLDNVSYFFRRHKGEEGRVLIKHSDYSQFFKNIFSVKQEWNTTTEKVFSNESDNSGHLRNLIFGSSLSSSPEKPILIFPVVGTSGEKLATLISGDRNIGSLPSSLSQHRKTEKKVLQKIVRLFSPLLEMERERQDLKTTICYKDRETPQNFNAWLNKVRKGIKAKNYHLYWIGEKKAWIHSSVKKEEKEHKLSLERLLKYWIAKPGVNTWGQAKLKIHSKIRSKITIETREDATLTFTFTLPGNIVEKVTGEKKHSKSCYLVIQFVEMASGNGFLDPELLYAQKAWEEGMQYLNDSNLINLIQVSLQSLAQNSINLKSFTPMQKHRVEFYQKNQLHLVVARPNSIDDRGIIKTDLKTGLNVGNFPAHFKYFRIQKNSNDSDNLTRKVEIIESGIDYFLSRSVDIMDYEKKLLNYLSEILKGKLNSSTLLERYVFFNLDSPTITAKTSYKKSIIGVVAKGFDLLHYSFKDGVLKKLPEFGYCLNVTPSEEDILLFIPQKIVNIGNILKKIESELVVFGQAFPDKLIEALGKICSETEFMVIKKIKMF